MTGAKLDLQSFRQIARRWRGWNLAIVPARLLQFALMRPLLKPIIRAINRLDGELTSLPGLRQELERFAKEPPTLSISRRGRRRNTS